jgi:hypothetical protein
MNFSRKGLALAFATTLGLGAAGQASADVYGGSYMLTDDLTITVSNPDGSNALGGAGFFIFTTDAEASINGVTDGSSGQAVCSGIFGVSTDCSVASPVLSGTAQNAPLGDGLVRGESDYTINGANGMDYSNAESEITDAFLVNFNPTRAEQIAESNLVDRNTAAANTLVQSNTVLDVEFNVDGEDGIFTVEFAAVIEALADVTGDSIGLAQANTSWTLTLTNENGTVVRWTPDGNEGDIQECGDGFVCEEVDPFSLNNALTSSTVTPPDGVSDSGEFELTVTGLTSGVYNLALAATTSTQLLNIPVPVPGTLLLMGAGLLAAGGLSRRRK